VQHILQEIQVIARKGAADVIPAFPALAHQLLKLGHDGLIAALALPVHAVAVMHLLPAVQAQHNVVHLAVGEVHHLLIQGHPVGGQGEAEGFAVRFLQLAPVGDHALHHIPVEQRLPAEKIHLQVAAAAGVSDQKVQRLLAGFQAHQRGLTLVFALAGKTVGAGQVAHMRHMQAQRLDDQAAVLHGSGALQVVVR